MIKIYYIYGSRIITLFMVEKLLHLWFVIYCIYGWSLLHLWLVLHLWLIFITFVVVNAFMGDTTFI